MLRLGMRGLTTRLTPVTQGLKYVLLCRAVFVARPGQELYTTYEKLSNGFWDAIRGNLAQYCFVDTLSKRADVRGPAGCSCIGWVG